MAAISERSQHHGPTTSGHVFIATSVDGFIARSDGDIAWLTKYATGNEDTGYNAFMDSIDGEVMGRGTFEKALTFGAWPFQKPVVIMSQTLMPYDLDPALADKVRVSRLPPMPLMEALAKEGWRRAYIDGGRVIQSFLREGLIADLILTRVPVLLGSGIPLFGTTPGDIGLRHVETKTFASGLVQSKYQLDA